MADDDGDKTPGLSPAQALPGRAEAMPVPARHRVLGSPLDEPYAPGTALALFGMGCFWGAERLFWQLDGVVCTAAGYAGGYTPNPTYEEVCTGLTGHAEVVRVVFDPARLAYRQLLELFWEGHHPAQGMRQGNDIGSQYRSALYCYDRAQYRCALQSRDQYQARLTAAGIGAITTEIAMAPAFYFAEACHQQYLDRHPDGYCGLGGTGVRCGGSAMTRP